MSLPSPAQEDNLRRLLDQRAARADIHYTRIPSLTEFSDSPSIYSHAHFSPHPPHLDSSPPQFDFTIPTQYARPSFDPVISFAPSTVVRHDLTSDGADSITETRRERSPSPESLPPDDEEPDPRMSFLGPTMRFHSPAPWETEDTIKEEEQEEDARSSVNKRNRSKPRGEGFIKSLARTAPVKATSAARPSVEYLRPTHGRDKVSIDSQVVYNISHALPQTTVSTMSPAAPPSLRPLRPGFVFSRGRARTASNPPTSDIALPPSLHISPDSVPVPMHASATSPVPTRSTSPAPSMYSSVLTPTDTTDPSRPASPISLRGPSDFVHPYANPDLAYDASPLPTVTSLPPSSSSRRVVVPSDSVATVSESVVTQSSSTLTPDTSMSSVADYHADVLLKKVVGSVQGKVISSPLSAITGYQGQKPGSQPIQDKSQQPLHNQVPGWTELSVSPTFNLISLQEAQAQARERSRTHTQVVTEPPFLQIEPPPRHIPIAPPSDVVRLRTRTASAGSKAKAQPLVISNPLPVTRSSTEDSQAAHLGNMGSFPRGVKQKKSGFMRLFNGKEKDKPPTPTPPPLSLVAAPSLPRTPKISSARVPVPTLSPSLVSQSPLQLDSIIKSDDGEKDSATYLQHRGSIKRQGPPLSIITQDTSPSVPPGGSRSAHPEIGSTSTSVSEISTDPGLTPASAPPSTTAFPELSLRPISTVFSAHFPDHIVSTDPSLSTTAGCSPLSLTSAQRPFDERLSIEDDPFEIIKQLQEQIKSTRKAWQHEIWELEGQVRDLRAEIDEMRLKELNGERCLLCGRTDEPDKDASEASRSTGSRPGVVNRPRARTGVGTRFGAAT